MCIRDRKIALVTSSFHMPRALKLFLDNGLKAIPVSVDQRATNQKITFYVPEVKNSAFDNATLRNLLDMTIATDFKEEYLDKTGIFNLYREATGFNPKISNNNIGLKDFLKIMPKSKEAHGSRYHYCSPNTDLLGWIIEKVSGTSFGNYFSKEIFQKCNPQYNAFITLDHENSPRPAGGICMVIDDLAKVAEMVRCKGSLENKQIIKERTISAVSYTHLRAHETS